MAKEKSSHVLVKFEDNWADEMDISGFRVMSRKDFDSWKRKWKGCFPTNEMYFGTNESVEYETKEDYQGRIQTANIDEAEAGIIEKCFGSTDWGTFVDPVEYKKS